MKPPTMEDKYAGAMLGLALGDALGAPHEGGFLGQAAWWVLGIGKGDLLRWSDDTQMSMARLEARDELDRLGRELFERGGLRLE